MELADPKFAELPEDGSAAVELIDIFSGYSCAACRYYTVARDDTVRHWSEAGHGTAEIRWTEVQLQTWMGGKHARYWVVRDRNDITNPTQACRLKCAAFPSRPGNREHETRCVSCTRARANQPCKRQRS
jgi:hypothetical protein